MPMCCLCVALVCFGVGVCCTGFVRFRLLRSVRCCSELGLVLVCVWLRCLVLVLVLVLVGLTRCVVCVSVVVCFCILVCWVVCCWYVVFGLWCSC